MPMVKLELGVPPAAATRPCAARPSTFQLCPAGEAMLVLDTALFQGVSWHLGRGRAWMPVGFAWQHGTRASFQMGWGRDCSHRGWNHSSPTRVSAKPQAAPGALVLT